MSTGTIKRTTIDLDVEALEQAKAALGTVTARDTVNTALRQVTRRARLAKAAALVANGELDLLTPEALAELRRPRVD